MLASHIRKHLLSGRGGEGEGGGGRKRVHLLVT